MADLNCITTRARKGQEKGKKITPAARQEARLPRKTAQKISAIQKCILDYLRQNPKASRGTIATYINDITEDGIKYHLKALHDKGFIKRIGPDKGGYWKVLSD